MNESCLTVFYLPIPRRPPQGVTVVIGQPINFKCRASHVCVVAMWCSVLQCVAVCWRLFTLESIIFECRASHVCIVAVCCSVLQCVAACRSMLQCVAVCCRVLQCVTACCSMLQYVAVCCSVLQCVAVCCSVLQCVAVCFSLSTANTEHRTYVLLQYIVVL